MRPETRAIHIGHPIDPGNSAVSPSIVLSTTFMREADGSFPHNFVYTRSANPNRNALEAALAALEGGVAAAAFGSGQAATMAIYHALAPGDHVILPADIYFGTRALMEQHYNRWGIEHSVVDMSNSANIERAIKANTKLVWVETPSNPQLTITDIRRAAEIAHSAGAFCVADNTWASPALQNPLALGADLVMHSTTKYIGGHSDVLGGAIVAKEENDLFIRIRGFQQLGGAVPSPFDCWLLLRSVATLQVRVNAASDNAESVARFLAGHAKIKVVHYPGLENHPGHAIAAEQMRRFGGMLSFQVKGGAEEAIAVAARVKIFIRATSLGGYESLIEHRYSIEGVNSVAPPGLLRCSIGLEHVDDLIEDLDQALGS